jgi:hypothetical protein
VQTTLYQNGIESLQTPTTLNGVIKDGIQSETLEQENVNLTDAQGHTYLIPEKTRILVERKNQSAPLDNGKTEKSGDFASARILHGTNPVDEAYLYFIQINGGKKGAQHIVDNHKKLFNIIQNDKTAHIVNYPSQNSTGYALLKENIKTNDNLLLETDTPCLTMIQNQNDNNIKLSIQNPELGKIEEMISYNEISSHWHDKSMVQPVVLTLKGSWKITEPNEEVTIETYHIENTKIRFNCFDGKAINVELEKK